jgi:hypothetical protein
VSCLISPASLFHRDGGHGYFIVSGATVRASHTASGKSCGGCETARHMLYSA